MKNIYHDFEKILADFEIISVHDIQNTAKLLLQGKYNEVEKTSLKYENFLKDNQNKIISSINTFDKAKHSFILYQYIQNN